MTKEELLEDIELSCGGMHTEHLFNVDEILEIVADCWDRLNKESN